MAQFVFFVCCLSASSTTLPPSGLLCNLLSASELTVITDPQPKFGWIVPPQGQSAYRILVSSSSAKAQQKNGDLWDSGEVSTSQSINVIYKGKALQTNQSYWWQVAVWDAKKQPSHFSALQAFNTGDWNRTPLWPGESRWIQVSRNGKDDLWVLEDRHPISYNTVLPDDQKLRKGGVYFFDFGKAAFANASFMIYSSSDAEVLVRIGERLDADSIDKHPGGGIIYREYPLALEKGEHLYQLNIPRFVPHYPHSQAMPDHMPEIIPFRYMEIVVGKLNVSISHVQQKALYTKFDDDAASFESSIPSLDSIYNLCKYSVKANTFNGDYSASQRERMMYEADCYIHQLSHYAVDREYMTARYSLENMIYHATWPTEWIMHIPLMAWADYWYTGDTTVINRHYDQIKPKTLLDLSNDNGLISTRTGKQVPDLLTKIHFDGKELRDIVDWPHGSMSSTLEGGETDDYDFVDYNTVVNAFHYQSLIVMSRIAQVLNKVSDQEVFDARAQMVKEAFNRHFMNPQAGIYVDGIGSTHSSLHANMFALAFELVPDWARQTVIDFIKTKGMACGVYGANYLLEALYDAGQAEYALQLLTSRSDRSWLNMLHLGSTITTEAWDNKYKTNNGWSHAWSASPAHIIPRKLMGVEALEAGFGKIRIKPQPASVQQASVKIPSIRGEIRTSFINKPGKGFEMEITIPTNSIAEVWVPCTTEKYHLTIDGKERKGIVNGNFIRIENIGSGTHKFLLSHE